MDLDVLKQLFDRGLRVGLGRHVVGGRTCLEGAVAIACGEQLNDRPRCVAVPDRAWGITINDAFWSSPQARASALWPIALAQVGTVDTYRGPWVRALVLGTVRKVLPIVVPHYTGKLCPDMCADFTNLEEARAGVYKMWAHVQDLRLQHVYRLALDALEGALVDTLYNTIAAANAAGRVAASVRSDAALQAAVAVALDAYRAEGRHQ